MRPLMLPFPAVREMLRNLVIAGVEKAGTTSLFSSLG
jgi:hypothetical protein